MATSALAKQLAIIPIACCCFASTSLQAAEDYQVPRNEFGQPDFSGTWSYASLTLLERPNGFDTLTLDGAQAQPFINGFLSSIEELGDPDTFIGEVNSLMEVEGAYRSSVIIDPSDGKLPLNEQAAEVVAAVSARRRSFAGPETRDLDERCLGSIGYPPLMTFIVEIPSKIVQTAEYVMIKTEDPTVARIIRLAEVHSAVGHRTFAGSSTGRWESNTLVVTTSHFRDDEITRLAIASNLIIGPNAVITERFTRVSESQLHYEYTVNDSDHYSQPWTGEFVMKSIEDALYEYSCHEGNYSMAGILAGNLRQQIVEEMSAEENTDQ